MNLDWRIESHFDWKTSSDCSLRCGQSTPKNKSTVIGLDLWSYIEATADNPGWNQFIYFVVNHKHLSSSYVTVNPCEWKQFCGRCVEQKQASMEAFQAAEIWNIMKLTEAAL